MIKDLVLRKEWSHNHYLRNKEKYKLKCIEYRAKNPEKVRSNRRKYDTIRRAVRKAASPKRMLRPKKEYMLFNLPLLAEQASRYRAIKKQAFPAWANKEDLKSIYEGAAALTKKSGVMYHVDHVIPLQHKLVCGLHVAFNLQIITMTENVRKNNKFSVLTSS